MSRPATTRGSASSIRLRVIRRRPRYSLLFTSRSPSPSWQRWHREAPLSSEGVPWSLFDFLWIFYQRLTSNSGPLGDVIYSPRRVPVFV